MHTSKLLALGHHVQQRWRIVGSIVAALQTAGSDDIPSLWAAVYLDTNTKHVASVWQSQGAMGAQDVRSQPEFMRMP